VELASVATPFLVCAVSLAVVHAHAGGGTAALSEQIQLLLRRTRLNKKSR
jgi:hypothetical protein